MRTLKPIDVLLPTVRQRILAATVLRPERWWYLRELARELHVQPSTLQRELPLLVRVGLLRRRQDGGRVYFAVDPVSPLLPELRGLLLKTVGLVDVLREGLQPLATRIRAAFVYGSIARGEEHAGSDVDLLVIGTVGLSEVATVTRAAEQALGRPVNPTVFSEGEFAKKVQDGHHFVRTVLASPKLFLLGNDTDPVSAPGRTPRAKARDKQTGTRRAASHRGS